MPLSAKIEARIRLDFFPEDYARAISMLRHWRTKRCAPGEKPSRMHLAVLKLAHGDLTELKGFIAAANRDFRDVLFWAEYSKSKRLGYVPCEPSKEVVPPAEEAFLKSIATDPADNTNRLVYADWLEERGDPRADYLRVLCQWLAGRRDDDQQLIEQERELRAGLSRQWLVRIRGMPVREVKKDGDRQPKYPDRSRSGESPVRRVGGLHSMEDIPPDLVIDDLPGPKRGKSPALYFRDEVVRAPGEKYFALAYTITEASMMNEIGCVLWATFDGQTTTVLGNPKGLYACCWTSPWCVWLDGQTFVFKAQYSDGNRRYVPLVIINITEGYAVLPGTNNLDSSPAKVQAYSGPFEPNIDKNIFHAIRCSE